MRRPTSRSNGPRRRQDANGRRSFGRSPIIEKKGTLKIPPLEKGRIRIIPLGGCEEVGKNMTVVETFDDIFIFDVGFQFVTEEETPGIDYIIPNIRYLEQHKKKIRAMLITHGHLDHIGAIPFVLDRLDYPPIYTAEITELLIRKRNDEFPNLKRVSYIPFEAGTRKKIGSSYIRSFPVTHSIPDAMGFAIETPQGDIVVSGDLKLDHHNGVPSEKEEQVWGEVGEHRNLFFMCDSTNAEQEGYSTDEHTLIKNIDQLIKEAPYRVIIGTFASQFARITKIIELAEKHGRKVVVEGRSMKNNVEIAKQAKRLNITKGLIISPEEANKLPDKKVLILATGAQGEEFAALMRIAAKAHKSIQLTDRDTIMLSSSIIPGNELSVQKLKDNLTRYGLKFYNYRTTDIHTSGHGNIEELLWINQKVNAKYFMPAYGYHSMLRAHAQAVIEAGFKSENVIIPDNCMVLEIDQQGELMILKDKVPYDIMAVDGFRVGEIQEVVIRDRKALTKDGIFVVIVTLDLNTGEMKKSLDIISRGFIYLRDSQQLMNETRVVVKKSVAINTKGQHPINFEGMKKVLTKDIERFLFKKTGKKPIVIPVVLGV
ncbi:MAG: ribonuclease J [Candidatus Harrisonbacteria bacterium]|nr:ribonuclease J [Candidatus Harrisonbacteria bacterium]